MSEVNEEKVILDAKLNNEPSGPKTKFKLNEKQAVLDIAKNLIQDYTFIMTMATVKVVFGASKDCDKFLQRLVESWEKRTSTQLAEEAKAYQDAIHEAFDGNGEVDEKTSEEIKKYMDAYSTIRDKAVDIAKSAVSDINNMILNDEVNNEEK